MSLMDRIKCKSFLALQPLEQIQKIELLQMLRQTNLDVALLEKSKVVRKSKKTKKASAPKKQSTSQIQTLLSRLSPSQLAAIKASYGVTK